MRSKYKDLSKNTLVFAISGFGSKIISFLLVPLYTYVLSPNEYGTLDLINTTVQLLIPILTFNIQDAVLRFSLDKRYKKEDTLRIASKIVFVSSVILMGTLTLLRLTKVFDIGIMYLLFLWISFSLNSINNVTTMYLKASNKMREISIAGILNTLLTCSSNILFLLTFQLGITGYMLANIIGLFFSILYMSFKGNLIQAIVNGCDNSELFRKMILYSSPLIANGIAWWINNASDRYILTFFCGAAINGIYAISYKIPSILAMIQNIFYNAWSVSAITEFNKDDEDGFIGNIFTLYTVFSLVFCSVIMIFNIPIAKCIYSNDFFDAWKYVPLLLLGTVFNGLGLFIGCIFTAVKKTKDISVTTIIGAVINTVLNFILIPIIGATGAAFATFFGYFVVFIIRMIKLKNIIHMKVNWSPIILSLLFLFIQCYLATQYLDMEKQILFLALIIILNTKNIIPLYKNYRRIN